MGSVEEAKPLDDDDRKMQFSEAMDSTSELQGFSRNSDAKLKEMNENEGSSKTIIVRCPNEGTYSPNEGTSPNDSIIKVVNSSFEKYPEHLRIQLCLKEHQAMFLNWSESVLNKRSSSDTPENKLVCLGKRQKVSREKIGTLSGHFLLEDVQVEILSRLPVKSVA